MRLRILTWTSVALLLTLSMPVGAYTVTQIIDATGDGTGNSLSCSNFVAADSAGVVYVSGFCSDNVFRITPSGTITEIIDSSGDGANALDGSDGVAVDAAGVVYVAGRNSDNAFRITPTGTITEIINAMGDGFNSLSGASGVTVDLSGNVYVAGFLSHNAFRISPSGSISEIIDSTGDGAGNVLSTVLGIAADSTGSVYVAGIGSDNAFRITPSGTITEIIDAAGDGGGNLLAAAYDVDVDAVGNAYVVGSGSRNAFRISPAGTITEIIDSMGDTAHPLFTPVSIAVDSAQNVYVAESFRSRVFQIPDSGVITSILDGSGDGIGNLFNRGNGVAVDSAGNVYATAVNSDNAFRIDSPPPTDGVPVGFEATLTLELGTFPPMITTGAGVAILAGDGPLGFDTLRLPQVLTLPSVVNPVTDPILTGLSNFGAAGLTINATLPAGSFAPITGNQALAERFALRGTFRICTLVPGCPIFYQIDFPFFTPVSPDSGLGVGGGAGTAVQGGPGQWVAGFGAWTVGSATLTTGATGAQAMRSGFLHAATSATTSAIQPNGGLQFVAPTQISVSSVQNGFETDIALFSTLTVHFIPEPRSAWVLASGVVVLFLLGRAKTKTAMRLSQND